MSLSLNEIDTYMNVLYLVHSACIWFYAALSLALHADSDVHYGACTNAIVYVLSGCVTAALFIN